MPNNPGNTNKDSGNPKTNGSGSQENMSSQKNQQENPDTQGSSRGHQGMKQPQQPSGGASSQSLRLSLTPEQQQQIRKATGRDASSLELSVEDIEDSLGEESSSGESSGESGSSGSSSRGSSMDDDYDDEPPQGRKPESEF